MPGYIHHIQWCVTDLDESVQTMMDGYKFQLIATREGQNREAVLQSGNITFLISQRAACNQPDLGDCYPWLRCSCRNNSIHEIDSVFNVCLEVGDVDKTFNSMTNNGSEVLHHPTIVKTPKGFIHYAVVTSPCDNVIHSLVNTQEFNGEFLPGFSANKNLTEKIDDETGMLTHIDHVAYVGNVGDTDRILNWYRECCGMERFPVSADQDPEDGAVFDDVGMKLTAGDWMSEWMCREDGIMWQDDVENEMKNFKMVIAEPLPDRPDSHVYRFLHEHGGPGLQHIGLSTKNITTTLKKFENSGAQFRKPPPTYYTLVGKNEEILAMGGDLQTFKELGILIDPEPLDTQIKFNISEEDDYVRNFLLQIFSFPVFGANTFFLEIIQRQGSKGFGAGNIRALAESIIELQNQHKERITYAMKKLTRKQSKQILRTHSQNDFVSLYSYKPKQLHKSVTQHSFDVDSTNPIPCLHQLKTESERIKVKHINSMTTYMMDVKQINNSVDLLFPDDYTCVK